MRLSQRQWGGGEGGGGGGGDELGVVDFFV